MERTPEEGWVESLGDGSEDGTYQALAELHEQRCLLRARVEEQTPSMSYSWSSLSAPASLPSPTFSLPSRNQDPADSVPVAPEKASSLDITVRLVDQYPEVQCEKLLVSSGQAMVYKGTFRGVPVAIKIFHPNKQDHYREELNTLLSLKNHPNVLQLRTCFENPAPCLITEFMQGGDLRQYLHTHGVPKVCVARGLAEGIARGLAFLHKNGIIHRDLKSLNILLRVSEDGPEPVLGDFGSSHYTEHTLTETSSLVGSVPWMAPELVGLHGPLQYSNRVDIYSFGMVLWELLSGKVPFAGLGLEKYQLLRYVHQQGHRPPVEDKWDWLLVKLMEKCWQHDPERRPSAAHILKRLEKYRNVLVPPTKSFHSAARTNLVVGNEHLIAREQIDECLATLRDCDPMTPEGSARVCRTLNKMQRELFTKPTQGVSLCLREENVRYFAKQEGAMELLFRFIDAKHPVKVVTHALRCLWIVGIDVKVCLIAVQLGSFSVVSKQLESLSDTVVSLALGTVWGHLEFMPEILKQVSLRDIVSPFTKLLSQDRGDYSLIGCLMSLSFDAAFRRQLAESDVAPHIIKRLKKSNGEEPLMQYVGTFTLAFLTLDTAYEEKLLAIGVLDWVNAYLTLSPQEVAQHNESMRWASITPFFGLLASRHEEIRRLGSLNCAALALTPSNPHVFWREGLVGQLAAIRGNTSTFLANVSTALEALSKTAAIEPTKQ